VESRNVEIHEYGIEFGKVALAHLLAVVSPGPDFAVVLRQSLGYGRRIAIWTSVGIGTAILLHVSYSLLGLSLLIKGSPEWFDGLKIAGALYIGWLGVQALRAPRHDGGFAAPVDQRALPTSRLAFVTGFLTNALNPKATLFFIALFATVISSETPRLVQAGYGLWMSVTTIGWFCLVSVLFTRENVRQSFAKHGHWVSRLLGVVLIAFALRLALSREW
jgi:RhtB (resistance to homoserine/threonine) family protein